VGLMSVFIAVSIVGSAPFVFKHLAHPGEVLFAYSALVILCVILARRSDGPVDGILIRRWTPISVIIALAALNLAVYPSMRVVSFPSTAPDALIEPVRLLLAGGYPYAAHLPGGVPASPGPGWLLLNLPLIASGLLPLLMPFYLGLAAWMLASVVTKARVASLFVLLLLICLNFLQKSVEGQDLFAAVCAMTAVTAGVWSRRSTPQVNSPGIAGGCGPTRV
jgi:hypothetical protein